MQNKQDNAGCIGEALGLSPTVNSATPYRGDRHISAHCYRHRLILPPLSTSSILAAGATPRPGIRGLQNRSFMQVGHCA